MRQQYHRRLVGSEYLIWDVTRLVRLAADLPVIDVPLRDIGELDENWWYDEPGAMPTPRSIAGHLALVDRADLSYPILLCAEGRLMDGMHRAVKALALGKSTIRARRFLITPAPDHRNVSLDDLPYPDDPLAH